MLYLDFITSLAKEVSALFLVVGKIYSSLAVLLDLAPQKLQNAHRKDAL